MLKLYSKGLELPLPSTSCLFIHFLLVSIGAVYIKWLCVESPSVRGRGRDNREKHEKKGMRERRSGRGWAEDGEELCLGTQCERTSDRKHQEEEFQNEGLSVKNTKYTETSSIVLMPPKTKTFMFASVAEQCHKLINKSYLINGNQFSIGIMLLYF